ncbi:SCO6745 family protein [Actinomadura soli]|uniref:SCO6745 family protein n=1 Tax=Actinomadura soli TaxID=2508997 RepID=UPI0038B2E8F2
MSIARDFWMVLEPLHTVTYFSPECVDGNKDVGLRGFWMGYFGSRGAPLGPVPAGVIEASFYGFNPARVRRAIPDAWTFAPPESILRMRNATAAKALRRVAPDIDAMAAEAVRRLRPAVDAVDGAGRVLFAANRDLPLPDDPVAALWQLATTLREHRGDGHIAVLAVEGLNGLEANVLASAIGNVPAEELKQSRGWSQEDWDEATTALAARGLMDGDGATDAGRALRADIEHRTDALATPPYQALDDPDGLHRTLLPLARTVVENGEMPFPNLIGMPRPPT